MTKQYKNEDLKTVVEHDIKDRKEHSAGRDISEVTNGSMAPDMKEIEQLGKDMERMKTNSDLQEEGLVPDPYRGKKNNVNPLSSWRKKRASSRFSFFRLSIPYFTCLLSRYFFSR